MATSAKTTKTATTGKTRTRKATAAGKRPAATKAAAKTKPTGVTDTPAAKPEAPSAPVFKMQELMQALEGKSELKRAELRQTVGHVLEALGAEHCVNITDDSFRADFGALATSLNATLAFDAVGGDTTRQIMLGMPGGVGVNVGGPKTRICVYGALGGGDIVMPKAGQMLGLKHSVSVEGWNYAGWMASIGDTRRYAEQAKAVRVHPQSCPGPRACLCFTRVPCCLSMPPACLAVCAYLRACAVAGVDAWRRPQDDLREAVSAGGLGGA